MKIIFIFILTLLLTGCTFEAEDLKKKIESSQTSLEKEEILEEVEETKKDPADMSLEEVEQELQEIEDLEADEGLDEMDEEL